MTIILNNPIINPILKTPFSQISYVANTGYTGNVIINKPSNKWSNGNILIACMSYGTGPIEIPKNWKYIDTNYIFTTTTSLYHICGSNEPSFYYFTSSLKTDNISVALIEYSGQNLINPIKELSLNNNVNNTPVFSTITTTNANGSFVVAYVATSSNGSSDTMSTPTGFSLLGNINPVASNTSTGYASYEYIFQQQLTSTSTIPNLTVTGTTNGQTLSWCTHLITIGSA